jgi:hypothetical protein
VCWIAANILSHLNFPPESNFDLLVSQRVPHWIRCKARDAPNQLGQLQITRLHEGAMQTSNTSLPASQVIAMFQIHIGNHSWCWFYRWGVGWGLAHFPVGSARPKSIHTCTHPYTTHFDHEDGSIMFFGNDCNPTHIHTVQRLKKRINSVPPWPQQNSLLTLPLNGARIAGMKWTAFSKYSPGEKKWNTLNRVALWRQKSRKKIKRRKGE